MRSRQEIKAIGKDRFKANYWPCVGALFLVMLVSYAISAIFTDSTATQEMTQAYMNGDYNAAAEAATASSSSSSLSSLVSLFIMGPLTIGLNFFFIQNLLGNTAGLTVGTPFTCAFKNYGRKLGGSLWMALFVLLWSLLLLIPGIIKGCFSYALTQYILADCPNVKARDALKLSMRIMKGHKGQLLGFYLSYLGWGILSLLTFGILGIFYTGPYYQSSFACWYLEVREDALRRGVITLGQLEGTELV